MSNFLAALKGLYSNDPHGCRSAAPTARGRGIFPEYFYATAVVLLGGVTVSNGVQIFINETFDQLSEPNVVFFGGSWDIVDGVGVGNTRAAQLSADLTGSGDFMDFWYMNGVVSGNSSLNRADYQFSFDIKVNKPNVTGVYVILETYTGEWLGGSFSKLDGVIPLSLAPQTFGTVTLNLADPLFVDYSGGSGFDPRGQTYEIGFLMTSAMWGTTAGDVMTIDNIQLQVVPEPSVLALACIGSATLLLTPFSQKFRRRPWNELESLLELLPRL